ncbi:hypothetical protein OS493_022909 [Desmophyllum pertusum]|uniref:Uncharacterized protein n=1 Tax=Desmophyllum pertusum TaxID=174260 RepID=A0A9W9ZMU4_9CNID|nr:hypothetical protein OS493_022909 [Desmophyllum pertusum]
MIYRQEVVMRAFVKTNIKRLSSHDKRYSDAIYMQNSGIAEKQWGNKTFLPTKQSAEKKSQALHAKLPNVHVQSAPSETRCTLDKPYSDAPNPWAVPSRSDLGLPPLPRRFAKVSLGQSGPAPPATNIDASLVKTSGKRQNDIGRTVVVDSQYEDDNKGHVEEKWTIKELLPSIYTEKKPQTVHKCEAVETLRRKIVKAEEKIEKEKIIWKKNILYKLKKVNNYTAQKSGGKARERGDIVMREICHRERGSKMKVISVTVILCS